MFGIKGIGRAILVSILLIMAGTFNIIYGVAALANANFWTEYENTFVFGTLHTWGWVTLLLGLVQAFAAITLLLGSTFGRVVAIVCAAAGALASLFAIGGAYPFWSLVVFALCVWCLHGLLVFGEATRQEPTLPGSVDREAGAPYDG
jgi:hypothetical protein